MPGQTAQCLALVGREGRDIDESGDLGVHARFADDRASVGVTDEKDRTILRIDQTVRGSHVIGDGAQRVLDRRDMEPLGLQKRNELGPT